MKQYIGYLQRISTLLVGFYALSIFAASPEQTAVDFLSREVAQWRPANGCFSCHNNGDGSRALFVARKLGFKVPSAALVNTLEWLKNPKDWDKMQENAGFTNPMLARIQFTSALLESGLGISRQVADSLILQQSANGSWPVEAADNLGSPATYGTTLATLVARNTLERTAPLKYKSSIKLADAYLQSRTPQSTLEAAALVMNGQTKWLDLLLKGQGSEGGFGPFQNAPAEVFDTAIALLALPSRGVDEQVRLRGRQYLLKTQQLDGGWPETTRPSGAQSYAQRISTSAWALLALLATSR